MANYNCTDATSDAYGEGGYGTCAEQTVGAPNTGFFSESTRGVDLLIIGAIAGIVILTVFILFMKRKKQPHKR